ncbi:unnamed protein product, partial [Mesorhabditis spiculigera]
MVLARIQKVPLKIWEHKKKSAVAVGLLYWAGSWVERRVRNSRLRALYAAEALKFGEQPISAEDRCRRVLVLANVHANERSSYDDFKENALPLLHLAGLQVNIIKAESEAQLEALAAAVDHEEADALYVVGGDATIGKVLTGMLRKRENVILPIGVFPAGYDNLTLKRLVPEVFRQEEDIRAQCESAMALVENIRRPVRPFKVEIDGSVEKPLFSIGDVGAGWFRHIEDRRKKLWYFGGLKRRWAYGWEMLKRSPEQMEVQIDWEEYCSGCNKCREAPPSVIVPWRWWHMFTGAPRFVHDQPKKDFSGIVNENCGLTHSTTATGSELILSGVQENDDERMRLRMRVGGTGSRLDTIREGWKRAAADLVHESNTVNFYAADVFGRAFQFQFNRIPEFVRRLYVSSDATKEEVEEGRTRFNIRALDNKIEFFLPNRLRFDATA